MGVCITNFNVIRFVGSGARRKASTGEDIDASNAMAANSPAGRSAVLYGWRVASMPHRAVDACPTVPRKFLADMSGWTRNTRISTAPRRHRHGRHKGTRVLFVRHTQRSVRVAPLRFLTRRKNEATEHTEFFARSAGGTMPRLR
jgi:hypothetical protein